MSQIKSVTLSLNVGDSINEQLEKQANIKNVFAIQDVRITKIMMFGVNVQVDYIE